MAGVSRVQQEAAAQAEDLCLLEQKQQRESLHSVNKSDSHSAGELHSTGAEMERNRGVDVCCMIPKTQTSSKGSKVSSRPQKHN